MVSRSRGPLPTNIGAPATRALAAVGVTDLDHLRDHSVQTLLALHGVGPKAVEQLQSALAEHGLSLPDRADRADRADAT